MAMADVTVRGAGIFGDDQRGIGPGLLLGSEAGVALAFLGFAAACVVMLWLNVSFALAAPALMLERQSVVAALRRSAKLRLPELSFSGCGIACGPLRFHHVPTRYCVVADWKRLALRVAVAYR